MSEDRGDRSESALAHTAATLPSVNLEWLDRCPVLASLRGDPRVARVRAVVATRAAELWA